jgi:hypothetical protein
MINERLFLNVTEWVQSGCPAQEAFNWSKSRRNWQRDLPTEKQFIESLPDSLSREDVRVFCASGKSTVTEKFTVSMIWGYGDLGYGSYRVKKMFSTPGFEEKINCSYELASTGLVMEAYEYLSKNRVQQLGPAFGTKWLSFISPSAQPAPIYDSFIAMWIKKFAKYEFAEISMSSEVWSKKIYGTYFEWMVSNSAEFGLKPDELELVIFQDATTEFSAKSKWSNL